jgi:caffeoyl-CoA O-methyltransferase
MVRNRRIRIGILVLAAGVVLTALGGWCGWYLRGLIGPEPAGGVPVANTPSEARILATLAEMRATGGTRFGVPEADGRRLRLLVAASGAKNVVEIGTSTGYSTLWLCLGVLETGGHVTTFELDENVAASARNNFRKAGVDGVVSVVVGDAHRTLPSLQGSIDLVFLDADKDGYVDYLDNLLPRLRPGGLILAHNAQYAPKFLDRVRSAAGLETVRLTQASGLSATLKKESRPGAQEPE